MKRIARDDDGAVEMPKANFGVCKGDAKGKAPASIGTHGVMHAPDDLLEVLGKRKVSTMEKNARDGRTSSSRSATV